MSGQPKKNKTHCNLGFSFTEKCHPPSNFNHMVNNKTEKKRRKAVIMVGCTFGFDVLIERRLWLLKQFDKEIVVFWLPVQKPFYLKRQ